MSLGPIPWTAMQTYATAHHLAPDVAEAFVATMCMIDGLWLTARAKEKPASAAGGDRDDRDQGEAPARPRRTGGHG